MVRADGHYQRIDDDVFDGDAQLGGALDDLGCRGETQLRVVGNALLADGQTDDRSFVLLHKREHGIQGAVFAIRGVDQRFANDEGQRRS
jgi:hypothetical protein